MANAASLPTPKPRRASTRFALETKTRPSQNRSRATFEAILKAAGDVLAEEGVDGFTLNAVVKRAGLTPPAVYRYFPNKYALLKSVGERLMEAQDEAVAAAYRRRGAQRLTETALIEEISALLHRLVAVTSKFPGAVAILRAMRAIPAVRGARLESERKVAELAFERLLRIYPHTEPERVKAVAWLTIQAGNSLIESVIEGETHDPEMQLRQGAIMLARLQTSLE
jgi:AcrR family transcriptional regulator